MSESLREQLQAAMAKQVEEPEKPEIEEEVETVEAAEEVETEVVEAEEAEEVEEELPEPPKALKPEIREKWKDIPPEVREEFIRLEETHSNGISNIKDDLEFGKRVRSAISPYEAAIRATGLPTEKAIENLLNVDYVFRSGDMQQKLRMFGDMAKYYNVDLEQLISSAEDTYIDPQVKALQQEVTTLKQYVNQGQQAQGQSIQNAINSFAEKHGDFEQLRPRVTALITSGVAKGDTYEALLNDAYEQARWADPTIRAQILADQKKADEAERKKAAQAEVAKKKQAAASVKGSTSKTTSEQTPVDRREFIRQQFYREEQRI